MNETFKKVLTYVVIGILVLYGCFSTVNWTRTHFQLRRTEQTLEQCGRELGQLRTAVANADNQQYVIRQSLDRCEELCRNTEDVLGAAATTVSGLRTTLATVRANEEAMAEELHYLRQYIGTDDSGAGDNTGE